MKKYLFGALVICGASWAETNENCSDTQAQYAGWYTGLGIDYQYNRNNVSLDDNFGYVAALNGVLNYDAHDFCLNKKGKGNVGGTFNLGYGDFIDSKIYLGADLTVDISGNREISETVDQARDLVYFGTTTVKNTGTVPTLAARLGAYVFDTLVYAKFGAAFVKSEVDVGMLRHQFKSNEFAPVLGFGF